MKKSIKLSLVLSLLMILACTVLFAGTTYAWFTDSAETAKNTISTGNLDITVSYSKTFAGTYAEVESTTKLFEDATNWQPGSSTDVVYVKIKNNGSLAAKVKAAAVISQTGTDLRQYFNYCFYEVSAAVTEVDSTKVKSMEEVVSNEYNSLAANAEKIFAVKIWLPTTVGNAANLSTLSSVSFGIKVDATQTANTGWTE